MLKRISLEMFYLSMHYLAYFIYTFGFMYLIHDSGIYTRLMEIQKEIPIGGIEPGDFAILILVIVYSFFIVTIWGSDRASKDAEETIQKKKKKNEIKNQTPGEATD